MVIQLLDDIFKRKLSKILDEAQEINYNIA